jgi:hypothetical protein
VLDERESAAQAANAGIGYEDSWEGRRHFGYRLRASVALTEINFTALGKI